MKTKGGEKQEGNWIEITQCNVSPRLCYVKSKIIICFNVLPRKSSFVLKRIAVTLHVVIQAPRNQSPSRRNGHRSAVRRRDARRGAIGRAGARAIASASRFTR